MKGKGKEVSLISYSLEADKKQLTRLERVDSIDYPSYCDFRSFSSPLVQQWGIRELPYFILVGPDGRIAAAGTDWVKDIDQAAKEL